MAPRLCPSCGVPAEADGNPSRPFCSERCRLLDLEGWLGERYAIPGDPVQREDGERADEQPPAAAAPPVAARGRRR